MQKTKDDISSMPSKQGRVNVIGPVRIALETEERGKLKPNLRCLANIEGQELKGTIMMKKYKTKDD